MAKHFENGGCGVRPFIDLWILNHRRPFDRAKRESLLRDGDCSSSPKGTKLFPRCGLAKRPHGTDRKARTIHSRRRNVQTSKTWSPCRRTRTARRARKSGRFWRISGCQSQNRKGRKRNDPRADGPGGRVMPKGKVLSPFFVLNAM